MITKQMKTNESLSYLPITVDQKSRLTKTLSFGSTCAVYVQTSARSIGGLLARHVLCRVLNLDFFSIDSQAKVETIGDRLSLKSCASSSFHLKPHLLAPLRRSRSAPPARRLMDSVDTRHIFIQSFFAPNIPNVQWRSDGSESARLAGSALARGLDWAAWTRRNFHKQ